jgi:L-ascorbate metabolism protein UlaG (beta-lactamase superfamily)
MCGVSPRNRIPLVLRDHFDKEAIAKVKKDTTVIVAPDAVAKDLPGAKVIKDGQKMSVGAVEIEAIPMYNKRTKALEGRKDIEVRLRSWY